MLVAIANHKGGVGKTSLAAHLVFRGAERGRVLAVDLDAQANLTATLGDRTKVRPGSAADGLFGGDAPPVPMATRDPHIDLLGASAALNATDRGQLSSAFEAIGRLKAFAKQYDLVVVDTAPALGLRLTAAIASAQRLLIPLQPESYAVDGVSSLLAEAVSVGEHMNPGLAPADFVINAVNARAGQHRRISQRLSEQFKVRQPWLRRAVAVADALAAGRPVWRNPSNTLVAAEWERLCDDLLDDYGMPRPAA